MNNIGHIGVAVRSIQEALPFYTNILGYTVEHIEHIPSEEVYVAFLSANGFQIELLQPVGRTSSVSRFIGKRGEGVHHIALNVEALDKQIMRLSASGIRMIDEQPRRGANNALVAFLHPKAANGVLFELCQKH